MLSGLEPGTGRVTVSFSRIRGVEPGPLLDSLYRYPYGCTEQLVSSALPLLFVDVLGGELGLGPERETRPRIQSAVNKLLNRQGPDGAFGLWRVSDNYASPWLGAYVTDFLYRARNEGYAVPQEALQTAYNAMQEVAQIDRWVAARYQMRPHESEASNDTRRFYRLRAAAYAQYVLARAGQANLSDIRYFHDAILKDTPSPLAKAHIGAALALLGDRARASSAFDQAEAALGWENTGDYYQSSLRDVAGVLALAVEVGETDRVEALTARLENAMKDPNRLNTQEKAQVLVAVQALLRSSDAPQISINGELQEGLPPAPSFVVDENSLGRRRHLFELG